jgi:hypothetical protein
LRKIFTNTQKNEQKLSPLFVSSQATSSFAGFVSLVETQARAVVFKTDILNPFAAAFKQKKA